MTSEFRPIPGFENHYEINRIGEIRSIARITVCKNKKVLKIKQVIIKTKEDHRSGYLVVSLHRSVKKTTTQYVHRLVAKTFIPNPQNKPLVNHLDGDKLNASVDNLEWVTYAENHQHAIQKNLAKLPYKNRSPVKDVCNDVTYSTMSEAAAKSGLKLHELRVLLRHPEKCNCLRRA